MVVPRSWQNPGPMLLANDTSTRPLAAYLLGNPLIDPPNEATRGPTCREHPENLTVRQVYPRHCPAGPTYRRHDHGHRTGKLHQQELPSVSAALPDPDRSQHAASHRILIPFPAVRAAALSGTPASPAAMV